MGWSWMKIMSGPEYWMFFSMKDINGALVSDLWKSSPCQCVPWIGHFGWKFCGPELDENLVCLNWMFFSMKDMWSTSFRIFENPAKVLHCALIWMLWMKNYVVLTWVGCFLGFFFQWRICNLLVLGVKSVIKWKKLDNGWKIEFHWETWESRIMDETEFNADCFWSFPN